MRISDWSSDVCASDLAHPNPTQLGTMRNRWWMSSRVNLADNEVTIVLFDQEVGIPNTLDPTAYESIRAALANISKLKLSTQPSEIGRASCRERVCKYV